MDKLLFRNCFWKGSSACFYLDENKKDKFVEILNLEIKDYVYDNGENELEIFNLKETLFLEKDYILCNIPEFDDFLKKYSVKSSSDLKYFSQEKQKLISVASDLMAAKKKYSEILDNNNLITNGIIEEQIIIPPTLFYELKIFYDTYERNEIEVFNFLAELFSLFAIADKSKITIEDETTYFNFTIFCDNKENHFIKVPWGEWDYFKNNIFYNCYDWILLKSEESFKLSTILNVVRQYIGSLGNFEASEELITSLDSILNRIIKNETKEYFEQQNKLKDEFIGYNKMEIETRSRLMKSLLGLITTVGIAYYGKIITIENFKFTDKNQGLSLIFVFGLIAVVFFGFTFIIEYYERKKYYSSLKNIYVKKFAFSEKDFESFLVKPSLFKKQWVYWITLLAFFFVIVSMIYLYSQSFEIFFKSIWTH